MPKILVVVPFPITGADLQRRQDQQHWSRLDSGTELVYRPVKAGPTSFVGPHDGLLLDAAIFEAGQTAQLEGFDAVCIDTMSDSCLQALRSVLDIPVVGPGKASMLYALTLGSRFSILAQWEPAIARYRKAVRDYGFSAQCASIRSFDTPPDFAGLLDGKEEAVFPRMLAAARACIATDGAEVLCLGSTTMHQAAQYLARELGVPVINPGPLSYQLADTLLALKLTHSRRASPSPRVPKLPVFQAMLAKAACIESQGGA
jgi:allantoin racemase